MIWNEKTYRDFWSVVPVVGLIHFLIPTGKRRQGQSWSHSNRWLSVVLVICLTLRSSALMSQTNIVNTGVQMIVTQGTAMVIEGNYVDRSRLTDPKATALRVSGDLYIQGDIDNSDGGESTVFAMPDFGTSGTVYMNGDEVQEISGNTVWFPDLELHNDVQLNLEAGEVMELAGDLTLGTGANLDLASGDLFLNGLSDNNGIIGEKNDSRVAGNGRIITRSSVVGAGETYNKFNLGFSAMTATDPLSLSRVERRHQQNTSVANDASISKVFSLQLDERHYDEMTTSLTSMTIQFFGRGRHGS